MPDAMQNQKFDILVDCVVDQEVRLYLEEARKCFFAGAYNASVVMAWCGTILYFRKVVMRFGVDFFAYQLSVPETGKTTRLEEDVFNSWKRQIIERGLRVVNDQKLLEACKRMGIVVPEKVQIQFRERRNVFAHPDLEFATPEEALELVSLGREVYERSVETEFITNPAALIEYAKQTTDHHDVEQVSSYLKAPENDVLNCAHRILDAFIVDEDANPDVLIILWRALWNHLDEERKESLWRHIEQELQIILETPSSLRTPEEFANFIVWPSLDQEHEARDRIGMLYVEWFERLLQEDELRGSDMDLARQLLQYLPESQRERLRTVLREMMRRYTE